MAERTITITADEETFSLVSLILRKNYPPEMVEQLAEVQEQVEAETGNRRKRPRPAKLRMFAADIEKMIKEFDPRNIHG